MHVLLIVIGLLLMLFGGGCTLIMTIAGISDPMSFLRDSSLTFGVLIPMGLAPLIGGFFLFRNGLRRDREKRRSATSHIDKKDGKVQP